MIWRTLIGATIRWFLADVWCKGIVLVVFVFGFIGGGRASAATVLLRSSFFSLHTMVVDLSPASLPVWLRLFIAFIIFLLI